MATKKGTTTTSERVTPDTALVNGKPQDKIEFADDNLKYGFAQVPRLVLRAKGLSDQAKILYALLLDYAWQNDFCFPGQGRLAQDMEKSVDTVQRTLKELRDYLLIDWKQQGLNRPNIYYILRLSDCCFLHPDTNLSGTPQICGIQKPHNCGIKTPQKRGTNNTKSKNTQVKNTQFSKGKALKTKKEGEASAPPTRSHIVHTTIRNGEIGNEHAPDRNTPNGEASKQIPAFLTAPPLTQADLDQAGRGKRVGLTSVAEIIASNRLQMLQVQASTSAPAGTGNKNKPQGKSHAAPEFIQGIVGDFAIEMGDKEHHGSCITRAANLYQAFITLAKERYPNAQQKDIYDAFYNSLYDARIKAKAARITKVNGQGRANRMPYFFTCLEKLLGLTEEEKTTKPPN